jgi:hypothetical protein
MCKGLYNQKYIFDHIIFFILDHLLMLLGRGPCPGCGHQIHDLMILLELLNRALESTEDLANLLPLNVNKVVENVQAPPLILKKFVE